VLVRGNLVVDNGGAQRGSQPGLAGIALRDVSNAEVVDNEATGNATGIVLERTFDSRVERNRVGAPRSNGNFLEGIRLERSDRNRISRNVAASNGRIGILVEAESAGTLLLRNVASGNFEDGIAIGNETTTVTRNRADFNGDLGINAVAGVRDGGGNRAEGNGDPRQCVNVACRPAADLAVRASVSRGRVRIGQQIRVRLSVRNLGPDTARGLVVVVSQPDQERLVSLDCGGGRPSGVPGGCAIERVPAGQRRTVRAVLELCCAGPEDERVQNGGFVLEAATPDRNDANNRDLVSTRIVRRR
jgi:uncharacterized repeat protein (TIGR01451 family)